MFIYCSTLLSPQIVFGCCRNDPACFINSAFCRVSPYHSQKRKKFKNQEKRLLPKAQKLIQASKLCMLCKDGSSHIYKHIHSQTCKFPCLQTPKFQNFKTPLICWICKRQRLFYNTEKLLLLHIKPCSHGLHFKERKGCSQHTGSAEQTCTCFCSTKNIHIIPNGRRQG